MSDKKNAIASKTILYNAAKMAGGIALLLVCAMAENYCALAEQMATTVGITKATAPVLIGDGFIGIILRLVTNKSVV